MKQKLFNRNFTLLWLGQAVSQLGNGAGVVATMWWIQTTTGSALAIGTLAMVQTLVGVILSPFAGVIVDRYSRKWIIVATDVIRGGVYCFFAYMVSAGELTLPLLYLGAAINAAAAQFFNPAITASVPLLVPDKQLERANSLRQMTQELSGIFSYALGGVLVALLGIPALLLLDGISFLLSALSEAFIHIPSITKNVKMSAAQFRADLRDGIAYVRKDSVLFRILQVLVLVNFCSIPFFLLLPKYVADHLGAGSNVYGYITSGQMAGMLAGTLLLTLSPTIKRQFWLVKWGIAIQASGFLVAPLLPRHLWGAQLGIYALAGLINSIVNIVFFTTVQRKIAPEYLGKTFSLISAMTMGMQPLASGISGILADKLSLTTVFAGSAILCILTNVMLVAVPGLDAYFGQEHKTRTREVHSIA